MLPVGVEHRASSCEAFICQLHYLTNVRGLSCAICCKSPRVVKITNMRQESCDCRYALACS